MNIFGISVKSKRCHDQRYFKMSSDEILQNSCKKISLLVLDLVLKPSYIFLCGVSPFLLPKILALYCTWFFFLS